MDFVGNYSLVYLRDENVNLGFVKNGMAASGAKHSETKATLQAMGYLYNIAEPESCQILANLSLPLKLQVLLPLLLAISN